MSKSKDLPPVQWTLRGGDVVVAHHPSTCGGEICCVHNPSSHHMAEFRQRWRGDTETMERICDHGIGHPDPDHLNYVRKTLGRKSPAYLSVHGCDGCCEPKGYVIDINSARKKETP